MKKRLLISSVLMSAVLACALGTGTYAWYSATAGNAEIGSTATGTGSIETTKGNATVGDIGYTITVSTESVISLTDSQGKSKVLYGTELYDEADPTATGTYTISAQWNNNEDLEAKKAASSTYSQQFKLTPAGQVVLLNNGSTAADSNLVDAEQETEGVQNYIVVTVTIDSNGVLTLDKTSGAFAVRAKFTGNQSGEEDAHDEDAINIAEVAAQ